MSRKRYANLSASVHQRLLNLSRKTKQDFNLLLNRYTIERLLYRMTKSLHADRFVLKGAMMFAAWTGRIHRPTRDLDLLGYGENSSEVVARLFRDICMAGVEPDGLTFDPRSIRVTEIREDQEYQGQRVELTAMLGDARIDLQVDVGFGDAVTPRPDQIVFPALLDLPAPLVRAYPKETVIAEKLQAMVLLGMPNSRMKDFYDLWIMSRQFSFDGKRLAQAIVATFRARKTAIPTAPPVALTAAFANEGDKATQWRAFLKRSGLESGGADLPGVIDDLNRFLMPPLVAASNQESLDMVWPPGGPWKERP